jgi:TonB-dependent receptor
MKRCKSGQIIILLLFVFVITIDLKAQDNGIVYGTMTDASTGEPLPFATVSIQGTTNGVVTNNFGKYTIKNVSTGEQVLVFQFIGYETETQTVNISAGETVEINAALTLSSLLIDEVEVSAQALGQAAAINQQVNSNTIVNVVSKDKIRELPDQNAAEAVGRLPGIAVQRNAGEGQKVVVRGLSPRLNSITVNGERIASTDPQDRSVDLSMISPSQLEGIEVYKALTPDRDADAVGGTVNFVVKKAPEERELRVRAETGYNSHEQEFGQYRANLSFSDRFFNKKLGLLATGNYQRANRSSDELNASWGTPISPDRIDLLDFTLSDILEVRERFGGSLALDYNLNKKGSNMLLSVLWGETDRDELRRRRALNINENRQDYDIRDRQLSTRVVSTALKGNHTVLANKLDIDWNTSYSLSRQQTPFQHRLRFREFNAFEIPDGGFREGATPAEINDFARNDFNEAFLQRGELNRDETSEDIYTAKVDFKYDLSSGKQRNSYLKAGAKIRHFDRIRDAIQFRDNGNGPPDGFEDLIVDFANEFQTIPNNPTLISMSNFIGGFQAENYLDGSIDFGPGLSRPLAKRFERFFADNYYYRNDLVDNEDYEANETILATYLMGEFNIQNWMLMGGLRVERTNARYVGFETSEVDDDDIGEGELGEAFVQRNINSISYTDFLPMVHVRYQFSDQFDVRLAYTQSLARPNFQNLVPWASINPFEAVANLGNPSLDRMKANNYDLFLSYYNKAGLFTIGVFYKELNNVDVDSRFIETDRKNDLFGFNVNQPINLPGTTTVTGIELDAQVNFRYLPGIWQGIVLYANATFINSDTFYPVFRREGNSGPPFFNPFFNNTLRAGRLPGQPDLTANGSLGYERGGFSGRISMTLQNNSFDELGPNQFFDSFTDLLVRWDAAISQKIKNVKGLKVYMNLNNFTNAPNVAFQFSEEFETNRELFGYTVDLGFIYTL